MKIIAMGRVLLPVCCALLLGRLEAADLDVFVADPGR